MQSLETILDWVRYGTSVLSKEEVYFGHGMHNALDEAAALVLGALHLPFNLDTNYWQAKLTQKERDTLQEFLRLRVEERIPTAYLTKRTLYGGYEFYVDERVLIPRSPIAEVIDNRCQPFWDETRPVNRILDLCCGSGCIGLFAKYENPQAEVVLADIDENALQVAAINRALCGMEDADVHIVQTDGFSNIEGKFDWILCNPPYVEEAEMESIAKEYLHEPRHALTSGADGLDLTRRLLSEVGDYLSDDGVLIYEVGMSFWHLANAYPEVHFNWLELSGGEGVFALTAQEIKAYRAQGIF